MKTRFFIALAAAVVLIGGCTEDPAQPFTDDESFETVDYTVLRICARGSGKVKSVSLTSSAPIAPDEVGASVVLDCGGGVDLNVYGVDFPIKVYSGNIPDPVLQFTLECAGRQVIVSEALDDIIDANPGSVISVDIEVVPDGALVSVGDARSYDKTELVKVLTSYIILRLTEKSGQVPQILKGVLSLIATGIFDIAVPDRNHYIASLEYLTKDPSGQYAVASGVVGWPEEVQATRTFDRIVSMQHGACNIDQAPSELPFFPEMAPVFQTVSNNVVVMADQLGLGSSRTPNLDTPFMHAALTGSACADMLRAAETYLASVAGFRYDEKSAGKPVGLYGYSQGGQGTMATLCTLQQRGYTERIDDVKAGGSPLDITSMIDGFLELKEFNFMGFIPYTLRGLIYGDNLTVDLHNVYAPEVFSSGMDRKFDSTMIMSWHNALGTDVHKVLHPDFFTEGKNADIDVLYASARSNSIINLFSPANPSVVTLYHEPNDELVPYSCSLEASRKWGCKLQDITISDDVHVVGSVEFYLRLIGDDVYDKVYSILWPLFALL